MTKFFKGMQPYTKKNGKEISCKRCKREFYVSGSNIAKKVYCSWQCYKNRIKKFCLECKEEFEVIKSQLKTKKFCSKKCYVEDQKKRKMPEEIKKKISIGLSKTIKERGGNWGLFKKGEKGFWTGKPRLSMRGEKHFAWKGGITSENHKIRTSLEYKLWRRAVYERDDYTCVWCGERGGRINADHIKSFSKYPALRFAIDNGRTLCVPCHTKTDTYGGRKK